MFNETSVSNLTQPFVNRETVTVIHNVGTACSWNSKQNSKTTAVPCDMSLQEGHRDAGTCPVKRMELGKSGVPGGLGKLQGEPFESPQIPDWRRQLGGLGVRLCP